MTEQRKPAVPRVEPRPATNGYRSERQAQYLINVLCEIRDLLEKAQPSAGPSADGGKAT